MPQLADLVEETIKDAHTLTDRLVGAANDAEKNDIERACAIYNLLDDFEQKIHNRRAAIRPHCASRRIMEVSGERR